MVQRGNFKNLPENAEPFAITVSYDMGRQKRACGKVYDSLSGDFFVGTTIRNIFAKRGFTKSLFCLLNIHKKDTPISHHECRISHNGSLGSLEAISSLKLLTHLYEMTNQKVYIEKLIIDDYSTLRKECPSEKSEVEGRGAS